MLQCYLTIFGHGPLSQGRGWQLYSLEHLVETRLTELYIDRFASVMFIILYTFS